MLQAIKAIRTQPQLPLPCYFGRKTAKVSFSQIKAVSTQPENRDKMDKNDEKTEDVMSHSFGEGYATRCDEEGFGGIYGGNQSLQMTRENKNNKKKVVHEGHPDYDKTQGSEVKEKEKGRHQSNAC